MGIKADAIACRLTLVAGRPFVCRDDRATVFSSIDLVPVWPSR